MAKDETIITLIGTRIAKKGLEFIFEGECPECSKCRLKNICMRLEKGRKYQIVNIRNETLHDCFIHDQGVVAIEVIKAPIKTTLQSRKAINGSKVVYESQKCNDDSCEIYKICNPKGIKDGDKATITEIVENVEDKCNKGKSLKVVKMQL
ncbi:UPF0179 family protein [Methanosalsum natronophilum]|uniref:UPF0179 protein D5R95_05485 n=1 Tax=Methanosalsum natronophilum TaxID=768733 RepID=A0A424YXC2_9EURY|nr:UPF0179 family protein [Methanosalsum natronophilum]MCS3923053.1 uncharacterized protein (UPF0179 family) [Methanosalsum natronophilum]RQD85097.1 MAG: UPF0179 family protein [Methanosalsum natronophilum]